MILNKFNISAMFSEAWYKGDCIGSMYGFVHRKGYYFLNSGVKSDFMKIGIGVWFYSNSIRI